MRFLIPAIASIALLGSPAAARPATKEERSIVASYLRSTLKDPYSVRSARISDLVTPPGQSTPRACVSLNAKNAYGAYTGQQVIAIAVSGLLKSAMEDVNLKAACYGQAYGPFPELGAR